ncbi:MAG: OmpA family protein [Campylobacterales bacterium]|nr:OmpA family protein [Campylobacterales bacterium]
MRKSIISAVCCIAIFTGCGEGPNPDMKSQDLRETTKKEKPEAKKVDKKLDTAIPVEKIPYESEMVSGKDGKVYNKTVVPVNGKNVDYELPIVYFDFDKFEVTPSMMSDLEVFAQKLKDDNLMDRTIAIGGHCDEWGADEYNIALGLKRAKATEEALKSLGVTTKTTLTSYGESKPVCMAHNKKCWTLNRRAEIKILP